MIFIDASFLIAIFLAKDQWHRRSEKLAKNLENKEKMTSDLVITEVMASIGGKVGGKASLLLFQYITDNYQIYSTDMNSLKKSMNYFLKYDGRLSLVDTISIKIMEEANIHEIASFDSDFDKVNGIVRIH
ncbi:type II toxin-antitoxin system VapC family toxin [Methanobrevibacter filiformis]|uniref:tRNA(FMet)-specific endonuclease VapC n=1 Tax=Methanobrevibacter filiformis TaxID=55758 RepID=A0A166A4F2_9EURY|nr:PIN domain-containing protein [Methanobrevibacter filiformis]KZX11549.1 tRNA(fMet)-specific endonuclease VapC [Methanobrevibacter filiformis]